MREEDLLQLLTFIAEEDAQISTIVKYFVNTLGYELKIVKEIVEYGINKNIFIIVENDKSYKNCNIMKGSEINKVDWSISNDLYEIYYIDFNHYREKLFDINPQIPNEFKQFISN